MEHYPVEAHTALQEFRPPASGVLAHRQDRRAAGKRLHAAATELMPDDGRPSRRHRMNREGTTMMTMMATFLGEIDRHARECYDEGALA